jgi:predicted RNA binding protein YcfA (HicA-like mRNA interferase family)
MAKLRRLSGREVLRILEALGFEVRRITGSHHHMQLQRADKTCRTSVPVHGNAALATGTLKSIYRQVSPCIPEDELKPLFYSD